MYGIDNDRTVKMCAFNYRAASPKDHTCPLYPVKKKGITRYVELKK